MSTKPEKHLVPVDTLKKICDYIIRHESKLTLKKAETGYLQQLSPYGGESEAQIREGMVIDSPAQKQTG